MGKCGNVLITASICVIPGAEGVKALVVSSRTVIPGRETLPIIIVASVTLLITLKSGRGLGVVLKSTLITAAAGSAAAVGTPGHDSTTCR